MIENANHVTTENGAILVETLSRYIAMHNRARINFDAFDDLLGGNGAMARRILILAGMKPSWEDANVWVHGHLSNIRSPDLTNDPIIAAVIGDWKEGDA